MKWLYAFLIFLFYFLFFSSPLFAASTEFLPRSISIQKGNTFPLKINAYSGSDYLRGVSVYITFNPELLEVVKTGNNFEITTTPLFTNVHHEVIDNKIYIYGLFESKLNRQINDEIATINFRALKKGKTFINVQCDNSEKTTKILKNDTQLSNIIDCIVSKNNNTEVTIVEQSVLGATTTNKKTDLSSYTIQFLALFSVLSIGLLLVFVSLKKNY